MLAQILHDLHVPRELLDGLPEDQKQLLFCKMREEQVRRYHQREEQEDANLTTIPIDSNGTKKKKKRKQVTFRLGADGNELCWVMGETEIDQSIEIHQQIYHRTNNENVDIHHDQEQLRPTAGVTDSLPIKNSTYYTVHRDERKQIEEISNNIQEARRLFERLESETRRLVLNKETEALQQQQQQQQRTRSNTQNDVIDEAFYHEIEERAKQADRERRETARRARDNFHRNSIELNVCFDSENSNNILLQTSSFNSSSTISRESSNEKNIQIEFVESKSSSPTDSKKTNREQDSPSPLAIVEPNRSPKKSVLPLTREDIRQWFCLSEIPYGSFRSSQGSIYPWFHGIISRSATEQLLNTKPIGTFLIRVNEKIFGYALSYRASDHCRHLLIEVISSNKRDDQRTKQHIYRFLGGAKHETFTQLSQLIDKYSNTPIRSNSSDVLRYPCDQIDADQPDYADLFPEEFHSKPDESLYISLETTSSSVQSMTHL